MVDLAGAMQAWPTSDPLVYESDVHADFIDGHAAYGGYLLSKACFAAKDYIKRQYPNRKQQHAVNAAVYFLRPVPACRVVIRLNEIAIGKTSSTLAFSLIQSEKVSEGKKSMVGTVVVGNLSPMPDRANIKVPWSLQPEPKAVDFRLLAKDEDPNWQLVPEIPWSKGRNGVSKVGQYIPRSGLRSNCSTDAWLRAPPNQHFTQDMMGFLSMTSPNAWDEYFNPGIWSNPERSSRVKNPYDLVLSSIHLDVKALLPAEGTEWIFAHVHAKGVVNGRSDNESLLFDDQGRLLLVTHTMIHMTDMQAHMARVAGKL